MCNIAWFYVLAVKRELQRKFATFCEQKCIFRQKAVKYSGISVGIGTLGGLGMRKYRFKQVENYIALFRKLNEGVFAALSKDGVGMDKALEYLEISQQKAIALGEYIEEDEGEGHVTVKHLEEFCEVIFQIHQELQSERGLAAESARGRLDHSINEIEKSAKNDIVVKRLFVFLPYKASMWDSMESIFKAARSDENCRTLVIPIPYFDKDSQGDFVKKHYEADLFPEDIPITKYDEFDFGLEHPDVIFFHNPYDQYNYVTSVHPFFYSDKLKEYGACLVYVPYFATAGGMGEGQAYLPSYDNADFLVVQSKAIIDFYKNVPREKFLPLGSPKFDAVIKKCENPPEAPAEWKEKMAGRKVYFYNTSLSGMLDNPKAFMEKMAYVFNTFRDRKDVCLIWRPHPLFESTLESMAPGFLPIYHDIRDKYVREGWGIYDTTPSIENTIALSDVYIGDSGTSVTSLFGVVGKPMFILNNSIHELPEEDIWKAAFFQFHYANYDGTRYNKYYISPSNDLYYSKNDDMHFEYFCKFLNYAGGGYYQRAIEYKNKIYLLPQSAQDILVIDENKNIMKLELEKHVARVGAFAGYFIDGNYVFLLPYFYGALVRFNMDTNEVSYLTGVTEFNVAAIGEENVQAARWATEDSIYMLSYDGSRLLRVDKKTMAHEITESGLKGLYPGAVPEHYGDDEVWLLPYEGTQVKCYNFKTKETKAYDLMIEGLNGYHRNHKKASMVRLFASAAFNGDEIIFAPYWGNSFVSLDRNTGKVSHWDSPFEVSFENKNSYLQNYGAGYFIRRWDLGEDAYSYFDCINRKQYLIDLNTKEITLEEQFFNKDEVMSHVVGFANSSHLQRYCCNEDMYNSLKDLLDENIHGHQFNKEEQLREYTQVNASPAGDCGEKVYEYLK